MKENDLRVKEWLKGEVVKLQSESQQEGWLTLRDAIHDSALMSAPPDEFLLHMKFIHLQLLMGCVVKMCSGGIQKMMRNPEGYIQHLDELTEPIREVVCSVNNGEDIAEDYSNAYGSTPTSAAAAMIDVLQDSILSGAMSEAALKFLDQHLVATHAAYKDGAERVYGAGGRTAIYKSTDGRRVSDVPNVKGQGCLACLVGFAVGGWAVYQIFHFIVFC